MKDESYVLINLEGLDVPWEEKYNYGDIIKGMNLEVKNGDFLRISGISKYEKNYLFKVFNLLIRPICNRFYFDYEDIWSMDDNDIQAIRNNKIGCFSNNIKLLYDMTVFQNIALPIKYGGYNKNQEKELLDYVLNRLDIYNISSCKIEELSDFEVCKVMMARAIVRKPIILVADSPLMNLCEDSSKKIWEILKYLNADGMTILVLDTSNKLENIILRECDYREIKYNRAVELSLILGEIVHEKYKKLC